MRTMLLTIASGVVMLLPTYAAAQRPAQPPLTAEQVRAKSPYLIGYVIGGKRGYSGQQRACYARIFARHASPHPRTGWNATLTPGYLGDLWAECRITR